MGRIMVKISADRDYVSLWTYSRKHGRSGQFVICRSRLDELADKRKVLSTDGYSYARLWLHENQEGEEVLKMEIIWLDSYSGDGLRGRLDGISLKYQDFLCCIEESMLSDGKAFRRLSLPEQRRPVIEFHSRRNLKEVARRKGLRRKLGKFLDRYFQWPDAVSIQVTDDGVPYSFFFQEERRDGAGICGGIILHGQEDLKKAYYGMHT